MRIDLEIGGCRLALSQAEGRRAENWPAQQFSDFVCAEGPADIRFDVTVAQTLPDLKPGKTLFDAGGGLWTLHEGTDGLVFESRDPDTKRPFNRAVLSEDFSRGTVYTTAVAVDGAWEPSRVMNPLMEVCLLSRVARQGGLMMHAAGVDWKGGGYVFSGPSGAGKTTLSDFFIAKGARILNDERIIVRDVARQPVVHGTPWSGANPVMNHASAALNGLYFIRHGKETNQLSKLSPALAVSLCVKQAFHPYWDRAAMEQTMASAEALIRRVGGIEYSFLNEPSAVDFLLDRPQRHAEGLLARVP